MTSRRELARLRLAAQRLAGPGFTSVADTVRWMTAVQAQDYRGALTSVALRTEGATRPDVEAALDAGEVVRSWPMRGTLHFVASEDLRWMLDLTAERVHAQAAGRRAQLGVDASMIEQARTLAIDALRGGRRLHRDQLLGVWEDAGLLTVKPRGYHLLAHLSRSGTLCYGPVDGGDQCIVLLDEWVPEPRRLEHDEALGEWALRYFRSHGPATVADFTNWTRLPASEVKAGLAVARPQLEAIEAEGTEYLMDPETPARLDKYGNAAKGVFLLPGFDEYLLGYRDRTAAVPAEFLQRIVPGGNGMFAPTVVDNGQVVGTWKRKGSGARQTAVATPFTSFTKKVERDVPRLYQALP